MSKGKRALLEILRRSPMVPATDVRKALLAFGFEEDTTKSGLLFLHPTTRLIFATHRPHSKEMKAGAVRQAIKQIEASEAKLNAADRSDDDDD